MINENRDFKGIWIPKEIWLSKDLTLQEKVFYVEIDSLDNENGCFANNEYFAKFFGISTTRVSKVINSLIKKGYLKEVGFDGRKRILKSCIKLKLKGDINKTSNEPGIKVQSGYKEKFKHNNTCNNITNNTCNNIDIQNVSSEKVAPVSSEKVAHNNYNYINNNINIKALANEINEKELLEYKNNKLMRAIIKVSKLNNIKNKLDTNKVKKIYDYCFSKGKEYDLVIDEGGKVNARQLEIKMDKYYTYREGSKKEIKNIKSSILNFLI